jgi:hypothetical protein
VAASTVPAASPAPRGAVTAKGDAKEGGARASPLGCLSASYFAALHEQLLPQLQVALQLQGLLQMQGLPLAQPQAFFSHRHSFWVVIVFSLG